MCHKEKSGARETLAANEMRYESEECLCGTKMPKERSNHSQWKRKRRELSKAMVAKDKMRIIPCNYLFSSFALVVQHRTGTHTHTNYVCYGRHEHRFSLSALEALNCIWSLCDDNGNIIRQQQQQPKRRYRATIHRCSAATLPIQTVDKKE